MRQTFELSLLGGAVERRYRKLRPEIDRIAWHKLETARLSDGLRERARRFWTQAAFTEHRAAAAFAAIVRALVEARAPIDLAALASTYVLDELTHTELCARVANALGGGVGIVYDSDTLVPATTATLPALGRAAELVLEVNCVSENFLQPMGRLQLDVERHPTLRAVSSRILKDESAHAGFGWTFFDWARPLLDEPTRTHLKARAARAVETLRSRHVADDDDAATFGWISAKTYRREAPRLIDERIVEPLRPRPPVAGTRSALYVVQMIDVADRENMFSHSDDDELTYEPVEFDPETSFVDDEIDSDTLAFRDAVRDIWAAEGRFDLLVP